MFPARQHGLSLIELMIAMTLGLLVIGAVSGVFLSTSRNYTQDELLSRLQENARYAVHVLAEDLSMGGYWGPLMTGENINTTSRSCSSGDTDPHCQGFFVESVLTLDNDCAEDGAPSGTNWIINIDNPIEVMKDVSTGASAHTEYTCIDAAEFESGSDILVVKRVEGQELASTRSGDSASSGDLFVRTNGNDAMLFEYDPGLDASESSIITDWRYRSDIYYIRNYFLETSDGIPSLVRRRLDGDGVTGDAEEVAQGIEHFRILFGIDTDGDATADIYESDPTVSELEDVTSARIYVLARSMSEDPSYENTKTYRLGDWSRDYSANPDGFYRRVFSTTVTLRNQRNRILTTGE